jgi:hypothetical protein
LFYRHNCCLLHVCGFKQVRLQQRQDLGRHLPQHLHHAQLIVNSAQQDVIETHSLCLQPSSIRTYKHLAADTNLGPLTLPALEGRHSNLCHGLILPPKGQGLQQCRHNVLHSHLHINISLLNTGMDRKGTNIGGFR